MTKTVHSPVEWVEIREGREFKGKSIGFVPTMGNLHKGHISLLQKSSAENDISVLSIFVNPTQFDQESDLSNYPRTFESDLEAARENGVDYILCPDSAAIYPDQYRFKVTESKLSLRFCGKHRPGHFDGVLTIMLKLLLLVRPDRAYLGEKDYQQFRLVADMARVFFLKTEIVPCPLIRDSDGLAFSSRNHNLSPDQRSLAVYFPKILSQTGTSAAVKERLEEIGFEVDYVEDFEDRRLAAVRIGSVRLIDNVPLKRVLSKN